MLDSLSLYEYSQITKSRVTAWFVEQRLWAQFQSTRNVSSLILTTKYSRIAKPIFWQRFHISFCASLSQFLISLIENSCVNYWPLLVELSILCLLSFYSYKHDGMSLLSTPYKLLDFKYTHFHCFTKSGPVELVFYEFINYKQKVVLCMAHIQS